MAKHDIVYETALEPVDRETLSGSAVNAEELRHYGFVVLRVNPETPGVSAALDSLGIVLPEALGMTGDMATRLVKWISPDEYLVTLPLSEKDAFIADAKSALAGIFSAVVDNSGGYAMVRLSGSQYLEMLSKITFYDIRHNLPVGKVVSTRISKAPVIFFKTDEDSLLCLLRWSFADYSWKLMLTASEEFH